MRIALIAATLGLVIGIITWNVVFDRAIDSAEQRYLAQQRQHPGSVTIRQVMDPAIHDAAVAAAEWAAAPTGVGLVVAGVLARRARRRPAACQLPTAN